MKGDFRLSLDSTDWNSSPKMGTALKSLKKLLSLSPPTPESVENFIAEFDWSNSVDREYYFALPYLVDLLTENFESLQSSLGYFSHTLMTPDSIPDDCQRQIRGCRHRIAALMMRALETDSSRDEFDYDESCYTYVATIAAVYMESYVGRLVDQISDEI